jgi:hypothetical protein
MSLGSIWHRLKAKMPGNRRVWRIAALAVIGEPSAIPLPLILERPPRLTGCDLRSLGGALFGFDITSMSAIISTQSYLCQFNQRGFDDDGHCLGPTSTLQGLIVAIMPLGSLFGALLSG